MQNDPNPATRQPSVSFYLLLAVALFVFIRTFAVLAPILLSLLLILLVSLAVNPMISRMRAWAGGRRGATALVIAALALIFGLTCWAFFVPMKASVTKLSQQLPAYWERLQKPLIKMEQQAMLSEKKLQAEVTTEIARTTPGAPKVQPKSPVVEPAPSKVGNESGSLRTSLGQTLQGAAARFAAGAFNAAQILVVLVTVFFGVTFMLMNPRPIIVGLFSMVPESHHIQFLTIVQRIGSFAPQWAGATLLGMLSIGVLVCLVMWPIFGFTDALALGLIAGIFEAIPYLGPILSAVPALLFAAGEGGLTPLWVLLAYVGIQAVENNVIIPIILSRGMKLHPLAVIFSMLLCVATFGVLGVLIAAPLVAIADILRDELYRKRFLPTVTDEDLDRLARRVLDEKQPTPRA